MRRMISRTFLNEQHREEREKSIQNPRKHYVMTFCWKKSNVPTQVQLCCKGFQVYYPNNEESEEENESEWSREGESHLTFFNCRKKWREKGKLEGINERVVEDYLLSCSPVSSIWLKCKKWLGKESSRHTPRERRTRWGKMLEREWREREREVWYFVAEE